jgi:hypothetical protein
VPDGGKSLSAALLRVIANASQSFVNASLSALRADHGSLLNKILTPAAVFPERAPRQTIGPARLSRT